MVRSLNIEPAMRGRIGGGSGDRHSARYFNPEINNLCNGLRFRSPSPKYPGCGQQPGGSLIQRVISSGKSNVSI